MSASADHTRSRPAGEFRASTADFLILMGVFYLGVPKSWRKVEIVQDVRFGFTAELIDHMLLKWDNVDRWAYILHDKDHKADGTLREPHIHCLLAFKNPEPTSNILSKFKGVIDVTRLEKVKSSWGNACAYLTHKTKNASTKYQYSDDCVKCNFDIKPIVDDAVSPLKDSRMREICHMIDDGTIKPFNIYEHVTMDEYVIYERRIKTCFDYRTEKLLSRGDRMMECVYIWGDSATGKTSYAKDTCEQMHQPYFVSSGSNDVLDGYKGQPCIILDDLRPSCMGLSDLLKMLDNNTSSSVKSRYKNKAIECEKIIITTTLPIEKFFDGVFESDNETSVQLQRRCGILIHMDMDYIEYSVYDANRRSYNYMGKLPNTFSSKYRGVSSEKDNYNRLIDALGLSADMLTNLRDSVIDEMNRNITNGK